MRRFAFQSPHLSWVGSVSGSNGSGSAGSQGSSGEPPLRPACFQGSGPPATSCSDDLPPCKVFPSGHSMPSTGTHMPSRSESRPGRPQRAPTCCTHSRALCGAGCVEARPPATGGCPGKHTCLENGSEGRYSEYSWDQHLWEGNDRDRTGQGRCCADTVPTAAQLTLQCAWCWRHSPEVFQGVSDRVGPLYVLVGQSQDTASLEIPLSSAQVTPKET